MNAIQGTWKGAQVVLDNPADWPEGCRVVVEPVPATDQIGLSEEEWPRTPEAIADWLKWFDSLEPVQLTPEEEADWAAARQKVKEYTIANQGQRLEGLLE